MPNQKYIQEDIQVPAHLGLAIHHLTIHTPTVAKGSVEWNASKIYR